MADSGFANGGKVERRRRKDRSAEGAETVRYGTGRKGVAPSPIFDFGSHNDDFGALLSLFYSLASCSRKNSAFGLENLADACIESAYNANHVTHH